MEEASESGSVWAPVSAGGMRGVGIRRRTRLPECWLRPLGGCPALPVMAELAVGGKDGLLNDMHCCKPGRFEGGPGRL